MQFGEVPLEAACGAILAHSVAVGGGRLRKGGILSAEDVARLADAGVTHVTVARLQPGDVAENVAAARLAQALCGSGLEMREAFTGRANLHATGPGILRVNPEAIAAVNGIHPMITVATLPEWQRVARGTMAATIKIIAYAVPEAALARACDAAEGGLSLAPPRLGEADLIVTTLDGASSGAEAIGLRLDRFGVRCTLRHVPHRVDALARALSEAEAPLRLVLTASATSDPMDVGPAALAMAGGSLTRFGMPVDPGNLLFLGTLNGADVVGLPGCARSPALNGADWVLERVICGQTVTAADIAAMGVGGLLKEIPTRPQPRDRGRE